MHELLVTWLVAQEVKGSMLIAAELQLPSEAQQFEQLTIVWLSRSSSGQTV